MVAVRIWGGAAWGRVIVSDGLPQTTTTQRRHAMEHVCHTGGVMQAAAMRGRGSNRAARAANVPFAKIEAVALVDRVAGARDVARTEKFGSII